jgi:glucokinase
MEHSANREPLVLGLDLGATKLAGCLLTSTTATIVETVQVPTDRSDEGLAALEQCRRMARELTDRHGLDPSQIPLGIGVCELVDRRGHVTSAATIDWREVDVGGSFQPHPRVVIESDVRAAAIAEARFGAGRAYSTWVYLTVGTGIAFTLVLDGTPYPGARGNALILGAPPIEHVASGLALARLAGTNAAEDAFATDHGREFVRRGARALGTAMAWLVNALDPQAIVVGGGLGLRDEYREAAIEQMRQQIEIPAARSLPVHAAELGSMAGAIGAAWRAASAS